MSRSLRWYARRLRQMGPGEIAARGLDHARHVAWARRQVPPGGTAALPRGLREDRQFPTPLPEGVQERVPHQARRAVITAADRLLAGDWSMLGTPRADILDPDWFLDPVTGRRAPQDRLAFRIDHRDESQTGNVKAVWELSRHHHLTVLATAWWLTREDDYAEVVARHLHSWWSANPFLSGVHWTSGIELGVRLISWAWVRRLLDDWPKVGDLFETNDDALRQIWWHQIYLSAFRSRGSSANNHAVAEACGRFVAACAFPWYAESAAWREDASQHLQRELRANTFDSGVNRELATDYHRFVTELGLVALTEADAVGHPLTAEIRALLTRSIDAAAAMLDVTGKPPRQGDGDEGRALVVDDPEADPWAMLLSVGSAIAGRQRWWPPQVESVAAVVMGNLNAGAVSTLPRPQHAPRVFADAGICLLRTPVEEGPEIWCRCDGGPHGFLSIAAHAHADALALEVRHDGVEVLVDPGTYCYHGEPKWRSYFRSTLAHNTVEMDGANQSVEGGPFLWSTQASARVDEVHVGEQATQAWRAHHTGYSRLDAAARHERTVVLERDSRQLGITDVVSGTNPHVVRLAFHLGPAVTARLTGTTAELSWPSDAGVVTAELHLPGQLRWSAHRGESDPILGWYSPRFGERMPTTTLIGAGECHKRLQLRTVLVFPAA